MTRVIKVSFWKLPKYPKNGGWKLVTRGTNHVIRGLELLVSPHFWRGEVGEGLEIKSISSGQ